MRQNNELVLSQSTSDLIIVATLVEGLDMPNRHVLTVAEQIRGVRAAIASPRTPESLRRSLRERLVVLQQKLEAQERRFKQKRRAKSRPGLLDWLGL